MSEEKSGISKLAEVLDPTLDATPTKSRRRSSRLGCKGSVALRFFPGSEGASGAMLNLSLSGCRVLIEHTLTAMENSQVEVYCYVNGATLILAGVIRHISEKGRRGMELGIEFSRVSARKNLQLRELITELKFKKAAPATTAAKRNRTSS